VLLHGLLAEWNFKNERFCTEIFSRCIRSSLWAFFHRTLFEGTANRFFCGVEVSGWPRIILFTSVLRLTIVTSLVFTVDIAKIQIPDTHQAVLSASFCYPFGTVRNAWPLLACYRALSVAACVSPVVVCARCSSVAVRQMSLAI